MTMISPLPDNKYSIIYADPPWRYSGGKGVNSKKWGNSLSSYDCMNLKELKILPVKDIASDDSSLFMWVTLPMIKEGLELMSSWGFTYKTTAFVWNKTYKKGKPYCGMGYWTRSGCEICILGFRGKMERKSKRVYQVISAPVTQHSKKPDEVKGRIIELMGDLTRIELFARQGTKGWDSWGNELTTNGCELSEENKNEEPLSKTFKMKC